MKKTFTAVLAAGMIGAATLAPAHAAPAQPAAVQQSASVANAAAYINSNVPVPGGFTAGSGRVANEGGATLPKGSTFIVRFENLDGSPLRGTTTVTPTLISKLQIGSLSDGRYRITLRDDLQPGESFGFIWSAAHWFHIYDRSRVVVEFESGFGGVVDRTPGNNTDVYDNFGRGF